MSIDNESSQEKYEIEAILSNRTTPEKQTEYLIKWKGFGNEDSTWEPLQNLIEDKAFDAIFQFENSQTNETHIHNRNKDVIDFLIYFKEFDSSNPEYIEKTSCNPIGHFPYDEPLKIIKLHRRKTNNELYALIEWKPRPSNTKPENSYINTRILSVFSPEIYVEYLESLCYLQT